MPEKSEGTSGSTPTVVYQLRPDDGRKDVA